ncbi:MAG TPA: hypothetical protein VL588_10565, partial [Bdellovibrionota bacterium]|nr:hypothetical protein [Bdellovibrionota bacterium]
MAADPRVSKPWLWVTPKWTFPAQDGARVATLNLLKHVTAQGRVVDYLALAGEEEKVDFEQARRELGVRRVYVFRRKGAGSKAGTALNAAKSMVFQPGLAVTFRQFSSSEQNARMERLLKEGAGKAMAECTAADGLQTPDWGTIVYDGLHPAAHSRKGNEFVRPEGPEGPLRVVYRAHNFESDIWLRKAKLSKGPLKAFMARQASQVAKFENSLAAMSECVATVSAEDFALFKGVAPAVKGGVVPIGYEFTEPTAIKPGPGAQIMFLGRMDWPPNREGLQWFLKEVWPAVTERRTDLT